MAKLSLRDALNTSLIRTKLYIDTELAKKANSSHGTHLTLGTGSGNAFRGDYGNTAYQHSQAAHAPSNAQKNSDITKAEIEAKLTGAITSHTHSYLPLSGGEMTGRLRLTTGATTADASTPTQLAYGLLGSYGNLKVLGNTDISTGTDNEYVHIAAGWGLDPAVNKGIVVRGTYAECFGGTIRPQYSKTINLTASTYNVNTWYPCVPANGIPYRGMHRINLAVQLNSGSKPSWSTHDSGFTCDIDVLATAGGWGTTSAYSICLQDFYSFANNRPAGYQQLGNSSKPLFYLRGGGIYTIYTDYDTGAWTIYTASTTMNSETFAPTTTAPGVSINRSTVFTNISGNASSASKLETARTLTIGNTGKSFNGSGNISWTLAEIGAAPASHGTHLTIGTGASNAAAGNHTHKYAGSSSAGGAANSAVKATQDSAGQQINTTYIKGLSVSGKTITYTKGDGTTGTITTQDTNTTYSAATQSAAGLMSAADKKKLDGAATSANNYSHPNSGATAGSYGPSANASPALGGTFSVPYFTINTAGHVTAASTKTITLPSDITTFTKSLKVTTSWMDVGISGTNLSTGTYAVQVFGDFAGQGNLWTEYFSGIMSWYSGGTNSTDADEISLHSCGHATSGNELYLRTLRQSRSSNSPVVKLQIATDIAFTAAVSITFKFKKLI